MPSGSAVPYIKVQGKKCKKKKERTAQEDKKMTNGAVKTISANRNSFMETAEKIRERKAARKESLRKVTGSLFSCGTDDPYNLSPEMQARLYL